MSFNRLTYLTYLLLTKKPFNWKTKQNSALLYGETLSTLKSRLKLNNVFKIKTNVKLETSHLEPTNSLMEILHQYKRPSLLRTYKMAGIKHDQVLYQRIVLGINSHVLYNFINEQIASVTYHFQIAQPQHLSLVKKYITENYLEGQFPQDNTEFTITDSKANKLMYELADTVKLIYINNNPEITQNINVALYHNSYSTEKYIDSTKVQLSVL
jgi:hypothetical protein